MDGVVLAVILLGVFHGMNPAQGWLFGVFQGIHRKRAWHIPATILVVSAGHIAAVAPLLTATFVLASYTEFTPLVIAGILVGYGSFRLVRGHRHRVSRLNVTYPELAVWGFLAGLSHGSALTLLALLTSATAVTLGFLHWVATAATMLAMAVLFTYAFSLNLLRRTWINYDLIWSVFLIVMGLSMVISFLAPMEL